MTKGLVREFLGLYLAMTKDIARDYPILQKGFDRDLSRLKTLTENHGTSVFTLFLPDLDKRLLAGLETGTLSFAGEPLSKPINGRTIIPRLFQGMWLSFFSASGCLNRDIDPVLLRHFRSLLLVVKKYRLDCAPERVFDTIKEYFDVDSSLPPASPEWESDGSDLVLNRSRSILDLAALGTLFESGDGLPDLLRLTQEIGDRVAGVLGEFLPAHARFRHGPGAVSDLPTGRAYKYAFPVWGTRLQAIFPAVEFAQANSSTTEADERFDEAGFLIEEVSSRLISVPKTQKAPRLIAAEPTCNQWAQQSIRNFLTDAIKADRTLRSCIDFSRQDLSGQAALLASRTKEAATVDLSAASDRLSCWLVERLFRVNPSLLGAFIASRTAYLKCDIDSKAPKLHKLRKFASMGSALTFPVQSICFLVLCTAAGLWTEGRTSRSWRTAMRRVRVYGDDLVVPVSWMQSVEHLFTVLGLRINSNKTFVEGNFRESCGTDAYDGHIVTPVQVRSFYRESAPSTLQSVVDASNNLYLAGYLEASNYVLQPVPSGLRRLIPWVGIGSRSFGLQTASGFSTTARKRWNKDLHRHEYESLRFISGRTSTSRHEGFENLLQYFTEDPSETELVSWESGVFSKPSTRMRRGWEALA